MRHVDAGEGIVCQEADDLAGSCAFEGAAKAQSWRRAAMPARVHDYIVRNR